MNEAIIPKFVDTLVVEGASLVFSSQLIVKGEFGNDIKPDHALRITTDKGETCAMWVEAKAPLVLDNASQEQLDNSGILKITPDVRKQITEQAGGVFHTYPTVSTGICILVVGTYFSAFEFTRSMFDRTQRSIPPIVLSPEASPTGELPTQRKRSSRQALREAADKIDLSQITLEDWEYVQLKPLCFAEPMFDPDRRLSPVFMLALKTYVAPREANFEPSVFDLIPEATEFSESNIVSGGYNGRRGHADGIIAYSNQANSKFDKGSNLECTCKRGG